MIVKVDFPKVTLVGVIDADLPLRMEDFRASERAFQMLVQVSGRAGRGNRAGKYIFKLMHPIHLRIQYARGSEPEGLRRRGNGNAKRNSSYPPYRHLIRHLFRSRSEAVNFTPTSGPT